MYAYFSISIDVISNFGSFERYDDTCVAAFYGKVPKSPIIEDLMYDLISNVQLGSYIHHFMTSLSTDYTRC